MRIVCHACGTSTEYDTPAAGAHDVDPVCSVCGSEFVELQEAPRSDVEGTRTRPRRPRGTHAAAAVLSGALPAGLLAGAQGPQGFTQHYTSDDGTQVSVSVTANVVPAALADTLTSTLTRMGATVSSRMATPGGGDAIVLSLPMGPGGPLGGLGEGGGPFTLGDYAVGDASFEALLDQLAGLYTPAASPAAAAAVEALPRLPVPPAPGGPDAPEPHEVYAVVTPGEACPVCHDEMAPGALVVQLPCSHCFHEPCLLPWLDTHNTCPVCRHALEAAGPAERRARSTSAAPSTTAPAGGDGSGAAAAAGTGSRGRAHAPRGNLAERTQHMTDMLASMREQLLALRTNLASEQAAAGGGGTPGSGTGTGTGTAATSAHPPPGRSISYRWDSPARSGGGSSSTGPGAGASPHPATAAALTAVGPGGVPRPLVRTNSGSQDGSRRRGVSSSSYPSSPVATGPGALSPLRTAADAFTSSRGSSPAAGLPPSSLPGGSPGWGSAGMGSHRRSWERGSGSSGLGGPPSTPGSPPPVTLPPAAFPPSASLLGRPSDQQQHPSSVYSSSGPHSHSRVPAGGTAGLAHSSTSGVHSSSQEQLPLRHTSSDASSSSSGTEPRLLTPAELSTFAAQVDAAAGVADQLLAAAVSATPASAPALAARLQSALTTQLGASQALLARSEEAAAAAAASAAPGTAGVAGGVGDEAGPVPSALTGLQSRQAASLRALSAAMRVNTAALAARTDQLEAASAAAAGQQEAVAARLSSALAQVAALRAREAALASQAEGLRARLAALRATGDGLRNHVTGLMSGSSTGGATDSSEGLGDGAGRDHEDNSNTSAQPSAATSTAAVQQSVECDAEPQPQLSQQAPAAGSAASGPAAAWPDGGSTPAVTCHPLSDLAASDASGEEGAAPPAAATRPTRKVASSARGHARHRPLQRSSSAGSTQKVDGSRSAAGDSNTTAAQRATRTGGTRSRTSMAAKRNTGSRSSQAEADGQPSSSSGGSSSSSSSRGASPSGPAKWFMRWWPR